MMVDDQGGQDRPETKSESGRRGGKIGGPRTRDRYGTEFYREIGRLGGAERAARIGREGYSAMGRSGASNRMMTLSSERRREISRGANARLKELLRRGRDAEAKEEGGACLTSSDVAPLRVLRKNTA